MRPKVILWLVFSFWVYLFLNMSIADLFYHCDGYLVSPDPGQLTKIYSARAYFKKDTGIPEPVYSILAGAPCHNAWVLRREDGKLEIVISEMIMKDFSNEELAGVLGHEFAHIPRFNQFVEHWQIDVEGADLTSREIMLKEARRFIAIQDEIYRRKRLLMFLLPYLADANRNLAGDFERRLRKIEEFAK